jgi:molecular chaperone HscB
LADYFEILGVPRRFGLDLTELERKFYQLSREHHPDRFTRGGANDQKSSLLKMSELNQAYRALKSPEQRRDHLLALEGIAISAEAQASQIPMELAESWFEVQDDLTRLPAFEAEFGALVQTGRKEVESLEAQADQAQDQGDLDGYRRYLRQIAEAIRQQSYLSSMARDIERLKGSHASTT